MKKKYSPYIPRYHATSFECPHCGVYAQQDWLGLNQLPDIIYKQTQWLEITQCMHCKEHTVWDQHKLVYPTSSIAPQSSSDMPIDIANDFNEARSVLAFSPRSSAALLRLALEKLCTHLKLPGKNFNEQIGAMVKEGLSPKVQKALDIVRVIGNNAVHPGES